MSKSEKENTEMFNSISINECYNFINKEKNNEIQLELLKAFARSNHYNSKEFRMILPLIQQLFTENLSNKATTLKLHSIILNNHNIGYIEKHNFVKILFKSNKNEYIGYGFTYLDHYSPFNPNVTNLINYEKELIDIFTILYKRKNISTDNKMEILLFFGKTKIDINDYFYDIVLKSRNLSFFDQALKQYGNFIKFHLKYISYYIHLLKPGLCNYLVEVEKIIYGLEDIANSNQDSWYILHLIYEAIISEREILTLPDIKNQIFAFRFDVKISNSCKNVLTILREILSDRNLEKPSFGYYYERYKSYEDEFLEILSYIPLSKKANSPNYNFGSPKIVNLHIQLGTAVESILKNYLMIFNKQRNMKIKETKYFIENLRKVNSFLHISNAKLKVKGYSRIIYPLKLVNNRKFKKGRMKDKPDYRPEWYKVYSELKHDLLLMEEKTNLELLLRNLGAYYIFVVYHPDNWYNLEYDWDSKIFDKFSLLPFYEIDIISTTPKF